MDFEKRTLQYIDDAMSDKIPMSSTTRKSIERHLSDLENAPEKGWYFDKNAALKVMKFIALLKHTKGKKHANNYFILEPWQCFIVWVLFGWKKADGNRRFSKSYTEIAKKNGKTAFASALADYLLIMDDEPEAEVYCAATKREQAKICFNQAKSFIEKNTQLREFSKASFVNNNVSILKTGSKMEPIGRDSFGLDGINPSGAIIDEYHEWSKDDVLESIESATVSRSQTLIFIITTAGFNKTWPCFNFRRFCLDILAGIKQQDEVFVMIFTPDETDDWKDEKTWLKSNPNLGVSVEVDKMRQNFRDALNRGGRTEVNFKTKNLNIWVDAPETWISDEKILANNGDITLMDLIGQECYMGLDLAGWIDINAAAYFFPNIRGKKAVYFIFWIPEAKVIETNDKVDYQEWQKQGHIIVTSGDVVDIDEQVEDIYESTKDFDIKKISFDPAKAYNGTIQGLQKQGVSVLETYPQGIRYMSEPSKELEKYLMNEEIDFMNNPIIRWMFRNVSLMRDSNDNIKPDKKKSINKIDGVVALINAIGGYMADTAQDKQIYTNHTLRVVE